LVTLQIHVIFVQRNCPLSVLFFALAIDVFLRFLPRRHSRRLHAGDIVLHLLLTDRPIGGRRLDLGRLGRRAGLPVRPEHRAAGRSRPTEESPAAHSQPASRR
jgi:hypothetical protein